jgi:hypothetical protein
VLGSCQGMYSFVLWAMLVECDLHLQFWPSAVLAAVRAHPQPCAVQGMELP